MEMGRNAKILLIAIVIVLAAIVFFRTTSRGSVAGDSTRVDLQEARDTQELNKEIEFPIKDSKGVEQGKLKFTITTAEIRDELVVQGKRRGSVEGRTFLVLNLKVSNPFEKAVEVNTRNYVRLSVNGNENEWLAPDLHNDPVEVQAISTKLTRVAFPINESDKNFVLQIGEIQGEKQRQELDLSIN